MSIELTVFLALVGYKALSKLCEIEKHRRMMSRERKRTRHDRHKLNPLQQKVVGNLSQFTEEYWEDRGMAGGASQAQAFSDYMEQRTGVRQVILGEGESYYPVKVFFVKDPTKTVLIDPADPIYDEAYWRAWRRKHKHEDDKG